MKLHVRAHEHLDIFGAAWTSRRSLSDVMRGPFQITCGDVLGLGCRCQGNVFVVKIQLERTSLPRTRPRHPAVRRPRETRTYHRRISIIKTATNSLLENYTTTQFPPSTTPTNMAAIPATPSRFGASFSGPSAGFNTDAPSMADNLPSVDFGFNDLRERMTQFTQRFDDFIERGRKRVLEERNAFRMNVAELEGKPTLLASPQNKQGQNEKANISPPSQKPTATTSPKSPPSPPSAPPTPKPCRKNPPKPPKCTPRSRP